MTTNQKKRLRDRLHEINKEEEILELEKNKINRALKTKEKDLETSYKEKCFVLEKDDNRYDYIKAFKIIGVTDDPSGKVADCLAVINGAKSANRRNELGLSFIQLPLWDSATMASMYSNNSDLLIDCFSEIAEEEFDEIREDMLALVSTS